MRRPLTKANELRELVNEDENGVMILSSAIDSTLKKAYGL